MDVVSQSVVSYFVITPAEGGYMFGLSIRQQDYLQNNKRFCMKLLPEVYLGPRNNPLRFGDDPAYDPDPLCGPNYVRQQDYLKFNEQMCIKCFTRGVSRS